MKDNLFGRARNDHELPPQERKLCLDGKVINHHAHYCLIICASLIEACVGIIKSMTELDNRRLSK